MADGVRGAAEPGRFEELLMPHMGAAFNLARWLVRNAHDAEDIVQESYLRAFRFFDGFHGGDARAWLLKIVRNTSYSFLEKNHPAELGEEFDEQVHVAEHDPAGAETALLQDADARMLRDALENLPVSFREVLILRELEGFSYKEIAELLDAPIGTVMSSLSRGRAKLKELLLRRRGKEGLRGVQR